MTPIIDILDTVLARLENFHQIIEKMIAKLDKTDSM